MTGLAVFTLAPLLTVLDHTHLRVGVRVCVLSMLEPFWRVEALAVQYITSVHSPLQQTVITEINLKQLHLGKLKGLFKYDLLKGTTEPLCCSAWAVRQCNSMQLDALFTKRSTELKGKAVKAQ